MSSDQKNRWKHRLLRRQGWRCALCELPLTMKTATLDHITPRARGGLNTFANVQVLCVGCNGFKADRAIDVGEIVMGGIWQ